MTDMTMTCSEFDARLADYLDGALDTPAREAVERHLAGCARCTSVMAALDERPTAAASLPLLTPDHDLWSGIAERIEPRVLPMTERQAGAPVRRGWRVARYAAAAAVLIAVTAVVTRYAVLTTLPKSQPDVATSVVPGTKPTTGKLVDDRQKLIHTYDDEILRLDSAVLERRGQLDPKTVAIIEKNLKLIDKAIAESRAALDKDPKSHFLNDQLARVLDQKVGLLRTVALLPTRT